MSVLTASRGLVTQPSELARPEGAMVVADNVVIDYDNTIQQRRGFREYSQQLSAPTKQLFTYKNRILTHYAQTLAYDSSGAGAFVNFTGSFTELVNGLRIKALETNGNFYFTTDEGIKKISVKTVDDLATAEIINAGAAGAIDLSGNLIPDSAGFLPAQSKVAYRMVFGYTDANTNLLLGSPSSRLVLTNTSQSVNQSEIFTVNFLTYAAIVDQDYFLFSTTDTGYFVWFNVGGSATAPINADTLDRQGIEVDIQGVTTNTQAAAYLANALAAVEGISIELSSTEVQITVNGAGDVEDPQQGSLLPSEVLVTSVIDGSITEGTPAHAELTFTIPQDVTTSYFYQVYRTAVATAQIGQTLNDIDPGDEEQFIFEFPVTQADITAGFITVEDNTPETFRASGAPLYTNAITGGGRGIVDANERPPIAQDIALFRQSTFYANTKEVHRFTFSILSVDNFVSGTSKFYVGRGPDAVSYTFTGALEITDVVVQTKDLTVGNAYFTINSANNDRSYYVWFDKGVISHNFNSTSDVNDATETITVNNHGFATNDKVQLTGTLPGGLSPSTDYYVIRTDANNFQLSSTVGGSAINLTDAVGTATIFHTPMDPAVSSKLGVRVPLSLYDNTLAGSKQALIDSLSVVGDFDLVDFASDTVRVTCIDNGDAVNPTYSTPAPGWVATVFQEGEGEDDASREVLLSVNPSVAVSIDLTARSLVRVINSDPDSPVVAEYLSGPDDLPGKILLKAKTLSDIRFYAAVSDSSMSAEFSPELPVNVTLVSIDEPTNTFTTGTNHNLVIGDTIYINDNPNGGPIVEFGGSYVVATTPSLTTFTLVGVDVGVDQPGPLTGFVYKTTAQSDNNVSPNRIYYSKISQPEAVPLVNFIDVGSKDKEIMRILALRDNLFVLKTDGVYLVTGASAPNFSVRLLDNSSILIAPDSAVVLNNLIYALTTQGVVSISESGVSIVSRPIEDQIKKFTTFNYNFRYTSFGVTYESDRSYLVWLPTLRTDNVATQCFRYSTITNTWTRWVKTNTCGIVNQLGDDRMYLGKGDRNFIEQERKNDERQDYADRDFTRSIGDMAFNGTTVTISSITDVEMGDVMVQNQYLTVPKFNRMLKKLDQDSGATFSDYYEQFQVTVGVNMANTLTNFVDYLNTDPTLAGTFTVPSGSNDILALQDDYNTVIEELNDPLSGTSLKNYKLVTDLIVYEVKIDEVVKNTNNIVINFVTWFIQGSVQIYKAIKSEVQWAPQHFGKPEMLKQISEGTLMFDQGTIYNATVSYSSDRSADFEQIAFEMDGPGFWVSYVWADTVWGGNSNGVPLRTLIPLAKQRCRYLNVKFKHFNARESYKLLGISLEPREVSTRGYR